MDSKEPCNHFPKEKPTGSLTEGTNGGFAWRAPFLPVELSAISPPTDSASQLLPQPVPPSKWKRRFKGIGLSLFLPICLGVVGFFVLFAWGDEGVQASRQWMTMIWWPATLIRLFVYLLITWLLLPRLLRLAKEQVQSKLHQQREQLFAQSYADLRQIEELDTQEKRIHQLSIPPWVAFCFLLLVELIFAQMPYFLF